MLSAIVGPISSTATNSSLVMVRNLSIDFTTLAIVPAALEPMSRIPRPNSTRSNPRDLESAMAFTRLSADFLPIRSIAIMDSVVK